jgi:predicted phage tail protein
MREVELHGELAKRFVSKASFDVSSVAEAFRALSANFKNFKQYIINYKPGFMIKVGDLFLTQEDLSTPIGKKDTIHIIPYVTGSGKLGTIIVGAALMWITAGAAAAAVAGQTTIGAVAGFSGIGVSVGVASAISQLGVGLVLAGVSSLLFAPPKQQVSTPVENTPNTYFNGAVNTVTQGLAVPIGYGKLIVGSAVISAGITLDSD